MLPGASLSHLSSAGSQILAAVYQGVMKIARFSGLLYFQSTLKARRTLEDPGGGSGVTTQVCLCMVPSAGFLKHPSHPGEHEIQALVGVESSLWSGHCSLLMQRYFSTASMFLELSLFW
jgi:hypothetical protein